jgi:alpha-mannosidase
MPVCVKGNNKNEAALKPSLSFCQLDKDNVILLTLKRAEDGEGIILRLLEIQGISATVTIFLPYINIIRAYQTNAVEENEKVVHSRKHTLKVDLKPFSLVTIRVIC